MCMGIDIGMFAKVKGKENHLTEKQVKHLSYRIADAFGYDWFWIEREGNGEAYGPRHALTIVKEFTQDGDSVYADDENQIIEVGTLNRYYGEGYERGPLPLIVSVAVWLELNIPHSEIYYGGDSSVIVSELFDKKARSKLFRHFAKHGHLPYVSDGNNSMICDFCEEPMTQYGYGQSYEAYVCRGCGYHKETHDKRESWKEWVGEEKSN